MVRIHVLGAGTPTPTPTRFGSSYVVEVCGEQIMVDCGPAATHKLVKPESTERRLWGQSLKKPEGAPLNLGEWF